MEWFCQDANAALYEINRNGSVRRQKTCLPHTDLRSADQAARYRYIRCAVERETFKSATSFVKHCLVEVARGDGAQQHAG
jgi:hypothetical protein